MSAEQVAAQQCEDNKKVAEGGAKYIFRIIKEIRDGLDPSIAMRDILNNSKDGLELKLTEMEQSGLLKNDEIKQIKEMLKPLDSIKDLEDGCYKAGAMDHIKEMLDSFKTGDSKTALLQTIKDSCQAPDSIRMNLVGTKDMELIKANIHFKAQAHGTMLQKETLNLARSKMKKQAKAAIKASTRSATTIAGKGAASAVLGVATGGTAFVAQIFKEIATAATRAAAKTIGIDKSKNAFERER